MQVQDAVEEIFESKTGHVTFCRNLATADMLGNPHLMFRSCA